MRLRRTPAPHTSRPRATRLRGVVAALLAAPLALGTLAATALPAAAASDSATIDYVGPVVAGEPVSMTFTCTSSFQPGHGNLDYQSFGPDGISGPHNFLPGTSNDELSYSAVDQLVFPTAGTFEVRMSCHPFFFATTTRTVEVQEAAPAIAPTTTFLGLSPAVVEPGNPIDATATVKTDDGPVQSGSVQFFLDGSPSGEPVSVDTAGTATTRIAAPAAGTRTVTATFLGTKTLEESTSKPASAWVKTKSIVTAVIPDRAQAPLTTLSAAVVQAPGLAAPTGTITFQYSEGAVLGKVALTDGTASLALPDLAPGYYEDVIAIYSGDENYGDGGSAYRDMIVDPAVPTTPIKNASVVTLDVPATITGTQVPVKVTVEPGMQWTSMGVAGVEHPEGTVEISLGKGGPLLKATLAQGTANVTFDGVAPGTYEVLAYYTGDKHFERSAGSATTTVTAPVVTPPVVTPPVVTPPTTPAPDLSGSTSTLPAGGTITLVARDFLPGETVSFYLHSDPIFLGTAVADANGVATLVVAIPAGAPTGEHHVRATGATSLRTAEIPVTVTAAPVVTAPIVTVPVAVPVVTPVAAAPVAAAVPAVAAPLASTGAELGSTVLLVSVLLGSGALLLAGRRRFASLAG